MKFPSDMTSRGVVKTTDKLVIYNIDTGAIEYTTVGDLFATIYAALALKSPIDNPAFTGMVSGISKAMIGLGNADNTADVNKNVNHAITADAANNANHATTADLAAIAGKLTTTNFTIEESGGKLVIKYGATVIASIDSAGYLKAKDDIEGFTSP